MIIKSLKLKNFRQFMGEHILLFSTNNQKNITLVLADNATGKTTLEQSFSWIFFGETSFKKKEVFNSTLAKNLSEQQIIDAEGTLIVEHLGKEYKIRRTESAKKTSTRLNPVSSILEIEYKSAGLSKKVIDNEAKQLVNEIMPKDLFPYFFFDGEKIEKIGTEIDKGKSKEFASAVRGMLGFNALYSALRHLTKLSSQYQKEYVNSKVDEDFIRINSSINSKKRDLDRLANEKNEIASQITNFESLRKKVGKEIEDSPNVAEKQQECIKIEKQMEDYNKILWRTQKEVFSHFSKNAYTFLAYKLMENASSILEETETKEKGIPGIESKAIEHILRSGKCICGFDLEHNKDARSRLEDLIEYLPPQNISSEILRFEQIMDENSSKAKQFWIDYKNNRTTYKDSRKYYDDLNQNLQSLVEQIKNYPDMKKKKDAEEYYYQQIKEFNQKLGYVKNEISETERLIFSLEEEKNSLEIKDQANKRIALFEEYVKAMVAKLTAYVTEKEKHEKEELSKQINKIFNRIFNNNMTIEIDDDYNIKVINLEVNESLEKSSAQNVSITFSFIAGIIEMARAKSQNSSTFNDIDDTLSTEPYPLVMDAPLSSFDTTRIKNVCEIMPKIAEQVIIFIKDTDGEIARKHMHVNIGKEYKLSALTNTSTLIEEVSR